MASFPISPPGKNSGFTVLNLANNHLLDYGPQGLFDTITVLDSLGIAHCGAGGNDSLALQAAILEVENNKVAYLGFSMTFPEEFWAEEHKPGTAFATESVLAKAIRRIPSEVDHIIVSFHWGSELMSRPKEYQVQFAHKAIDLGADLVLGHHAHVLQGIELYNNGLILYGLGNFVFGSYSEQAKQSIILKAYLGSVGLIYAQIIPISVYNNTIAFQPVVLRGKEKNEVIAALNELSRELNGGNHILNDRGIIWNMPIFSIPLMPSQSKKLSNQ